MPIRSLPVQAQGGIPKYETLIAKLATSCQREGVAASGGHALTSLVSDGGRVPISASSGGKTTEK